MARLNKKEARVRRHRRVRRKVSGTAGVPRMSVYCSGKQVYVQFIDDEVGHTITAASTLEQESDGQLRGNVQGAAAVGRKAAERALSCNIKRVVFDRGGFNYHGRVKALADAAREAGLEF